MNKENHLVVHVSVLSVLPRQCNKVSLHAKITCLKSEVSKSTECWPAYSHIINQWHVIRDAKALQSEATFSFERHF